jgi:glycosyltransferase involved in cell wall biosynthesis
MITVFTPAYNRKYIIDKLYQSLLCQTSFDFEWLIVDDGSTDDTKGYFDEICAKDNPFPIRYFYKENGGKHKAINYGVERAQGEVFFIVDSDDSLTPDAIEKIGVWAGQVCGEENCAGVAGTRGYTKENRIGSYYDERAEYIDATNLEREKYNLLGDKAEAYFTRVLKKYPFPEFENERFLTEEVVWNQIAMDGLYLRWYPDIIYIGDYLGDGLTKAGDKKYQDNPKGTLLWSKQQLAIYKKGFKKRTLAINRYYKAVKGKKSVKEMAKELGVSACRCRIAIFTVKVGKLLTRS